MLVSPKFLPLSNIKRFLSVTRELSKEDKYLMPRQTAVVSQTADLIFKIYIKIQC